MWQELYQRYQGRGVAILSVAMDAQETEKPRRYLEKAGATFTTVVDAENLLGSTLGFKAIPNGLLLDEQGILRYAKYGGFDIRKKEYADLVTRWLETGSLELSDDQLLVGLPSEQTPAKARELFRRGVALYQQSQTVEALALWKEAFRLAPDDWVIRKQIWAVEHPEKFYQGAVDYSWQREQIEAGR